MSKFQLLELVQKDINDIKGIMDLKEGDLSLGQIQSLIRGITLNLEDHLEDLIQY